jgi:hypothetical protein
MVDIGFVLHYHCQLGTGFQKENKFSPSDKIQSTGVRTLILWFQAAKTLSNANGSYTQLVQPI